MGVGSANGSVGLATCQEEEVSIGNKRFVKEIDDDDDHYGDTCDGCGKQEAEVYVSANPKRKCPMCDMGFALCGECLDELAEEARDEWAALID